MIRKIRPMNKRGQINGIIVFMIVVVLMIMVAPFLIKLVVTPATKFSNSLTTIDTTNKSSDAVNYIQNKFTGMFDWVILFFFIFSVMTLLISSFLIDVHPAFLFVYIIALFMIAIISPGIVTMLDTIYNANGLSSIEGNDLSSYLPMVSFLKDNFVMVMLGIMILSGIIMYGKFKLGSNAQTTGGTYY